MNEELKQKAKTIIEKDKKSFNDLDQLDVLIAYLNDGLSSFGYYNACNEIIEEELFNIFIYLYNHNNKLLEKTLETQYKEINLYEETLKTIHRLTSCITDIDYLYDDIIKVCNAMAQKLYNKDYTEFLIDYISE